MIPPVAHSASDLNIRLEALLGIIVIAICVVYIIFGDKIRDAIKKRKDNKLCLSSE